MTQRYWEPHTSSIDFCETNYLHFDTVVEWHNTWSSLSSLVVLGVIGAVWNNPTREIRTVLAYLILALIGVGSTGLHLSLHWIFQACDELPMLYLSNCINFMALEYDAPIIGKPNYPLLPHLFGLLTIFHTIMYYRFQHHYIIFFFTYAFGVVLHVILGYRIVYLQGDKRGPITRQLIKHAAATYLCFGVPVWFLDMFCCDSILGIVESVPQIGLLSGITPHVLWHFAAAYGTYCAIACVVAARLEELQMPFELQYLLGVIPVTVRTDEEIKKKI